MTYDQNDSPAETIEDGEPDVMEVCREFGTVRNDFTGYTNFQQKNWQARHCIWLGQTPDQRKRARIVNGVTLAPFPWNGASDLKIPVLDEAIGYAVALDWLAFKKANIRATPVGMDDLGKSTVAKNFMRWLVSQMTEMKDEAELLSQVRHSSGLSVAKVFWETRVQMISQTITLEQLGKVLPDIPRALEVGTLDDEIAAMLIQLMAGQGINLRKKRAKQMVGELRDTQQTKIPVKTETINRPRIEARTPGEDIWFPVNTTDIQNASAIYDQRLLTPTQSREMIYTEDWDKEYVDYAADRCASYTSPYSDVRQLRFGEERLGGGGIRGIGAEENLVEWIYAYQKRSDENGVPGVYLTIFCPDAKDSNHNLYEGCAWSGLLEYRHGMYPFVPFKRERLSRCLLDSRGIPEIATGYQNAIKVEGDSRIDGASLGTAPIRFHPPGKELKDWGPHVSVPQRRLGEYGYLPAPPFPNASIEVETGLRNFLRAYLGRVTSELDAQEASTKTQKQVDDFMYPWKPALRMIWELYQQYGPDEEFFRVTGVPKDKAQKFNKSEFSAKYDFEPTFDVLSLDPETMLAKLEKAGPTLQAYDTNGQLDREKIMVRLMGDIFGAVDAEDMILPQDAAANKEIKETQDDIAKMWAGVDIDPPMNSAAQLRMQVIQQWSQGSPDNPAIDVQTRLAQDQTLQKRIKKYNDQLQFQVQQKQVNPQIGRQGARPAYQPGPP